MKSMFVGIALGLALIGGGGVAFAAPAAAPTMAAPPAVLGADTTRADRDYVLGPSDVVEVGILGRTDYTTRDRVAADGTIQLQYLGSFPAANKTTQQLSADIAQALDKGGFFTRPTVRVDIVSYASRYVTVLGNVMTPGLVPVDRPYHLSEVVARVGGVKPDAADYVILVPQHGEQRHIRIATLATGGAAEDPLVTPGDKIYAPQADLFYLSGQVKQPGAFGLMPDMTVRMAIARGGGLTDSGSLGKVSISRKGKKITRVDLESHVEAGDIITIGERLF